MFCTLWLLKVSCCGGEHGSAGHLGRRCCLASLKLQGDSEHWFKVAGGRDG